MSPQEAMKLTGHSPDIVERLGEYCDSLVTGRLGGGHAIVRLSDLREARAEIDRLMTALRAVRASTDPRWQAQLISDALRETKP